MKKIFLRCLLTLAVLLVLRFIYIKVTNVAFFEQVFISTSIGFIFAQILVEILFLKGIIAKKADRN